MGHYDSDGDKIVDAHSSNTERTELRPPPKPCDLENLKAALNKGNKTMSTVHVDIPPDLGLMLLDLLASPENRPAVGDPAKSEALQDPKDTLINAAGTLTRREMQVMEKLAGGSTNREIADSFDISVKTVDTHRGHILKKLGLRNNSDLTRFAVKHGYVKV